MTKLSLDSLLVLIVSTSDEARRSSNENKHSVSYNPILRSGISTFASPRTKPTSLPTSNSILQIMVVTVSSATPVSPSARKSDRPLADSMMCSDNERPFSRRQLQEPPIRTLSATSDRHRAYAVGRPLAAFPAAERLSPSKSSWKR
jgi:hypothetical protein